jgi:hypothetical protein
MPRRRKAGVRVWFAGALALALVLGACGDDGDDAAPTTTAGGELTNSFRGVTADTIKLGIVIIDYQSIAFAVDFNRGDQQPIAQLFVDDINENGGILGRQIEPVYKVYEPLGSEPALEVCTALTEDEEVFAVLGVFIDFSGQAQLCLTREHETIHIGHELQEQFIKDSPPGLLLTPDITQERRVRVIAQLAEREGVLEGKKVAIVTDQNQETIVNEQIKPALDELGLEQGSTGILNIAGTDTSQAQAQLDSFIERWKDEDITAFFISGQLVAGGKQFIEKLKAAFPDAQLVSDVTAGAYQAAQDAVAAGQKDNNPYEGLITADGENAQERWDRNPPLLKHCREVYEEGTGEKIIEPDALEPGPDGKRVEIYVAVQDFCGELNMFKQIAEKAGPNLTNDTWVEAVNNFGKIELVTTRLSSLSEGKYDAEDGFRLLKFDSSLGNKGDWDPLTDYVDASKF